MAEAAVTSHDPPSQPPRIALLHWGDLIEDFLDSIGVSFDGFRDAMTGGWMFGYVDALAQAGVETVLVCVTAAVDHPERHRHKDTGATLWRLPASRIYLTLRRLARQPIGQPPQFRQRTVWEIVPYLSTPFWELARVLRQERCRVLLCQDYEHPRFDACVLLGSALRLPVYATFQGGSAQTYRLEHWTRPPALRCVPWFGGTKRARGDPGSRPLWGLPREDRAHRQPL